MGARKISTKKWLKLWWTWRKLYALTFPHFSLHNNEFIEAICGKKTCHKSITYNFVPLYLQVARNVDSRYFYSDIFHQIRQANCCEGI